MQIGHLVANLTDQLVTENPHVSYNVLENFKKDKFQHCGKTKARSGRSVL